MIFQHPKEIRVNFAIVIIDPQKGWLNSYTSPIFEQIAIELSRFKCWDLTIISTFSNTSTSSFRQLLPWWNGFQNNKDLEIIDEFTNPSIPLFPRETYGLSEPFWQHLQKNNIGEIVLTGVETDASIVKTAMDAFDRKISVMVPIHLVGSTYGPKGNESGMAIIKKVLGKDHVLDPQQTHQWFKQKGQNGLV